MKQNVAHICPACHCQHLADAVCIHAHHASACDTQAGHARSQVAKSVAATEGKKKKSAAKADTGPKVKGAKSAYIYFSNDKRAELKGVALSCWCTLALTCTPPHEGRHMHPCMTCMPLHERHAYKCSAAAMLLTRGLPCQLQTRACR